jgi:DNA-binding LacI/PurR family transcriptional regulator
MELFIDRALDHLLSRGRKRIGFLTVTNTLPENLEFFESGVASRGMTTRPAWMQCVGWPEVRWASNCVQSMMQGARDERPDGLIIFDDNIQEHAAAGMMRAGVRVPEELEVVAHCNFPVSTASVLPLTRLGFDAGQILRLAIDHIDRQRQGKRVPALTLVPPRFEHEPIGTPRT